MAIVINNTPVDYSSLNGDLIFTSYESVKANDPVTYVGYKYICDVYVGGTLITRLKSNPDPVYKRGFFNIARSVRNYLSFQFNPSSGFVAQTFGSTEWFLSIQCQFGEEYGGTLYTNLTTDSTRVFYNHYNGRLTTVDTILASYIDRAASNRPYQNYVNTGRCFLPYFAKSGSLLMNVKKYDSSNNLLGSVDLSNTLSNLAILDVSPSGINAASTGFIDTSVDHYIIKQGVGNLAYNIRENTSGTFLDCNLKVSCDGLDTFAYADTDDALRVLTPGSVCTVSCGNFTTWSIGAKIQMRILQNGIEIYNQNTTTQAPASLITSFTVLSGATYIVQARTLATAGSLLTAWSTTPTPSGAVSLYRFDIYCETKYTPYTIHFLNKLGGFESFDFRKVSRKTLTIDKKTFQQQPYRMDSSGAVSLRTSNGVMNDTDTTYAVSFKEKMKLFADVTTDAQYKWLSELVTSPIVYFDDSGTLVPVTISNTDYEFKKVINDKITSLSIDIEFGKSQNTQFR